MRDSAAGDSRAADLIGRRARCRPLSYETFDGDRADVTTLETMMRMVEGKMQQDSLHPDVALYVVRPIWTIRPLSDFADDAKIIFRYRPKFSSSSALSNLERNGVVLPASPGRSHAGTAAASWALLGRLRAGEERIRSPQLRFDRGALARRRRRKLRAQLVPFLFAVPTSMDFGGVQTSTHDDDSLSGIVTAAGGIGRRTPRHVRPRATIRRHPKGRRMPKRAIYQRKVDGKWAVIELPDDYKDGDRLSLRGSTDQWFDSRDEARAELLRRATED